MKKFAEALAFLFGLPLYTVIIPNDNKNVRDNYRGAGTAFDSGKNNGGIR